jgi:excisionase family DNA binding protein
VLPDLLTPKQTAEYLGIKTKTVHQLVREGKLACIQITPKDRKFTKDQLEEFIANRTIGIPMPVDRKSPARITLPRKGGDRLNCGDSDRAQLKKEMCSW